MDAVKAFHAARNPENRRPVIGMAARFATEKGVEVLVNALPQILGKYPQALVQFAGPYQNIIGEEAYSARLMPQISRFEDEGHWKFLGSLNPEEMAAFYPNIDVLVLPSLNSTEAFGLVQIEAMINGVPCVASNLPGVRQPVLRHGMGKIVPIGDSRALADAVIEVVARREDFRKPAEDIARIYIPDTIADEYECLVEEMFAEQKHIIEKRVHIEK
jgi:glycosyltransferase involved in cell wall biosynthesis